MTNFIALYRGRTVADAELVAVSAEPGVVARFFEELLGESPEYEENPGAAPLMHRRMALRPVGNEASE